MSDKKLDLSKVFELDKMTWEELLVSMEDIKEILRDLKEQLGVSEIKYECLLRELDKRNLVRIKNKTKESLKILSSLINSLKREGFMECKSSSDTVLRLENSYLRVDLDLFHKVGGATFYKMGGPHQLHSPEMFYECLGKVIKLLDKFREKQSRKNTKKKEGMSNGKDNQGT